MYKINPRGEVSELPKPHYSTPSNNYLSGDWKSHVWMGQQHYVPSERNWITYHDYRSLPRETKRDAIDMQSEDQWVTFTRQRDTPAARGYLHKDIGIHPIRIPEVKLSGYTRNLPTMPHRDIFETSWPKCDQWVPPVRGGRGEYYGYYHEAIETERERRKKDLPTSMRVEPRDVPRIL